MRCFLVCYDISDAKRWRAVHKIVKQYGESWQYSVFFCRLRGIDRVRLELALKAAVDSEEDRVLICDLGPDEEAALAGMKGLGRQIIASERLRVV